MSPQNRTARLATCNVCSILDTSEHELKGRRKMWWVILGLVIGVVIGAVAAVYWIGHHMFKDL